MSRLFPKQGISFDTKCSGKPKNRQCMMGERGNFKPVLKIDKKLCTYLREVAINNYQRPKFYLQKTL
jgi:hypothetical protein